MERKKQHKFDVCEEVINEEEDSEQGSQLQSNKLEISMGNKQEKD